MKLRCGISSGPSSVSGATACFGYGDSEARRLCAAFPGSTYIQKPYTAQQIGEAVESLRETRR